MSEILMGLLLLIAVMVGVLIAGWILVIWPLYIRWALWRIGIKLTKEGSLLLWWISLITWAALMIMHAAGRI